MYPMLYEKVQNEHVTWVPAIGSPATHTIAHDQKRGKLQRLFRFVKASFISTDGHLDRHRWNCAGVIRVEPIFELQVSTQVSSETALTATGLPHHYSSSGHSDAGKLPLREHFHRNCFHFEGHPSRQNLVASKTLARL